MSFIRTRPSHLLDFISTKSPLSLTPETTASNFSLILLDIYFTCINLVEALSALVASSFKSILTVLSKLSFANNFYDYPLFFLVDACQITQQRHNPNDFTQDEIMKGREKYSICMNFIMSLSTTLKNRCINLEVADLSPEENFTYADLSKVKTTQDIIQEVLLYSKKYPQFDNQIAWLHAAN